MKYTINDMAVYNPSDGTILSTDNAIGMITLTQVTSELLLLFIKNKGMPISRDAILSELWEKKGLSSSSNNLNNYISMLRKALAQCGCPDVITTVPKYGFIFEAVVVNSADLGCAQGSDFFVDREPQLQLSFPIATEESGHIVNVRKLKKIKITTLVISLLLIMHLPWIYNYLRLKTVRTEIFRFEQCRFYLADDLTRSLPLTSTMKTIKKVFSNNDLKCDNETDIYFFVQKKQDSHGQVSRNGLLAYCPLNRKISCANYYINKYQDE